MNIKFEKKFAKQYKKAPNFIKKAVNSRMSIFKTDPFHLQLRNHQLIGSFKKYRSINITGDWRALFTETMDNEGDRTITFYVLGTHSQLYR